MNDLLYFHANISQFSVNPAFLISLVGIYCYLSGFRIRRIKIVLKMSQQYDPKLKRLNQRS